MQPVYTFLWCALIITLVFYLKFVLEAAEEKEAMTSMTAATEDKTDAIRRKMEMLERKNERMAGIRKGGISAAELSLQWSPTLFVWNALSSIYNTILGIQTAAISRILQIV